MAESAREQHLMSTTLTPVAIETLNRAQLTRVYNSLTPSKAVKAFATLTKARERVQALLDYDGRALAYDGAELTTVQLGDEPTVEAPAEAGAPVVPATIVTDADAELALATDEVIDPANLPELTTLEHRMLTAVLGSEFHDGNDPVGNPVWVFSIYEVSGISERSRGGVVASLVKKGFAELSMGEKPDDCVAITRRGAVALAASDEPLDSAPAKAAPAPAPAASAPRTASEPRPAKVPGAPRVAGGRTLLDPATRRGPLPSFDDDYLIHKLVAANPKREGAATHAMFEIYRDGMTVAAYVAAGGRRRELNWDVRNGWVSVSKPGA